MLYKKVITKADNFYIQAEISKYLEGLTKAVEEEAEGRKKEVGGQIEITDCLCWVMAIDLCGEICEAYMNLQNDFTCEELDARNTASALLDFHDLVVAKCNNPDWKQLTIQNFIHSLQKQLSVQRESISISQKKI